MRVLGIDTSNYTTSAAVFDGAEGFAYNRRKSVFPARGRSRREGKRDGKRPD